MLKQIAQQTFESYQKVRQLVIDTECRYLTDADEVDEKLGFITDSVVYRIMECLGVTDENSDDGFGVISECIQDGDSFEYMLERLKLNYSGITGGYMFSGTLEGSCSAIMQGEIKRNQYNCDKEEYLENIHNLEDK